MERDTAFEQKINDLPDDIRDAIFSIGVEEVIQNLAPKYKLSIEQTGSLITEVYMFIVGIITEQTLRTTITKELKIDSETLEALIHDLNQYIFEKIREEIKQHVAEKTFEADFATEEALGGDTDTPTNRERVRGSLSQSGIDVEDTTSSTDVETDRDQLLRDIENPPKTEDRWVQKRLSGETQHKKPHEADYSVDTERYKRDPYREIVPEKDER